MTPFRNLRTRRGFTLVEILVVLLIFGVVIAMAALITRAITAAQYRSLTNTRIATVDSALVQFVQQQRRLPCPADGTKDSSANNVGLEGGRNASGCTGNQQGGVVPWRTLGLSEVEATDGWGRRFTYRTDPKLTADGGMDMSWCDPAGTEAAGPPPRSCNTSCTSSALATCTKPVDFLRGLGLVVKNNQAAHDVLMDPASGSSNPPTGAAYVVISPGDSGGGGYLGSGQLSTSNTTDGTEESKNYANQVFTNVTATYYVDDSINSTAGASHFDDVVSRPSVLSVVTKAGLGPRSH